MSESAPQKKRKKVSGLTGLELQMALAALRSVKTSLKEQAPSDNRDASQSQSELFAFGSDFEETLDKLVEMMQSKADGPQALAFSGVKYEHLKRLSIEVGGSLSFKEDFEKRIEAIDALGAAEHWSSDGLYRHLKVLQDLVATTNEAAARTWIDSFFFRASAMMPPSKKLVLTLEQSIPATSMIPFNFTTVGGFIDYTAITVNKDAETSLMNPILDRLTKHNHTLFVLEAKARDMSLQDHVPQAVCEMYACAKTLRKDVIRGALTDGQDWIFIILKMKPDGDGGVYAQSEELYLVVKIIPNRKEISRTMCSVIAGIIAHWIDHSNDDIGDDDWFAVKWT